MPELNVAINGKDSTKGAREVNSALDSIGSKSRSLVSTAINPLTAAIAGIGSYKTVEGLISSADKYTTMAAQLDYVTGSSIEAAEAQNQLYEMSQKTGTAVTANSDALIRLSQANETTGLTTAENIEIIGGLNALMLKTGTSGASASTAMTQLTQSLAAGNLAGDEFRSILESSPALMKTFAQAMGVGVGELKKLASEGKINTDVMVKALRGIAEEGEKSFDDLPKTASSGWQRVVNAFQQAWDKINDETGILSFIFDALVDLSEWIEEKAPSFSVWIERMVNSLRENWPEIKEDIQEMWNKISELWQNVSTSLPSIETFFINLTTTVDKTSKAIEWLVGWLEKAKAGWSGIKAAGEAYLSGESLGAVGDAFMEGYDPGNEKYIKDIVKPVSNTPSSESSSSSSSSSEPASFVASNAVAPTSKSVNIYVNQKVSKSDIIGIANGISLSNYRS